MCSMNSPNSYKNVGRYLCQSRQEDILKPTIENESLHEISNWNGVSVVNFATFKNLK
jgi:hypothetical protein